MSNQLTVLNNQTAIQQGGLGVNLGSKLFSLKPATLNIIQPNSQAEGKKGSIRILETGDTFTEMDVVLLQEPESKRNYFTGIKGELNRNPENLLCFSSNGIVPDPRAKKPQAIYCANCPKNDWGPWRSYTEKHPGQFDKNLIPECEPEYRALVLDTKFRMPLRIYIRGKSLKPFERAMDNFARTIAMAQAQGKNPNIFDVKFKIKTKQITTGKFVSYIYDLSNFTQVTPEEREAFGDLYMRFVTQQTQQTQHQVPDAPDYDRGEPSAIPALAKEIEYEEGEIVV